MSAMYTKGIGTPGYTAPEVLVGGGGSYNGRLADVFSSGERLFMGNGNATMRRLLALKISSGSASDTQIFIDKPSALARISM